MSSSPASTTRFHLGFFTTELKSPHLTIGDQESSTSYLAQLPVRQSTTGIADLGYGSYYGATRLDVSRFTNTSDSYSLTPQRSGEKLNLSLEAGGRHEDLSAGMLYAYRSSLAQHDPEPGVAPYPIYIFTPMGGYDGSLGERSHDGHAVFLYLGYNLSQQLNIRGTLGLAKTSTRFGDEGNLRPAEQSRRWGVDLAATYRLLDNLVYEAHLGYVSIEDSVVAAASQNAGTDAVPLSSSAPPASLYQIGSHIRMTF
ncbi:hypothetical protein ACHHRT_08495 [Desulfurivibrio sp. D14AmB]|uniref:hypothetical protein n=1 Tax=Desulfurivibrio sp. D14AmB TaxID=3374370 RepID=UPI00376F2B67